MSLSKASPVIERRFDHQTLEALPLTGFRDVQEVLALTPGVTYEGSSNGQRTGQNVETIEGLDNADSLELHRTIYTAPEGVEELHIRTNAYSAELGRGLGAQLSVIGRRGTNRFRGEAWDFYGADWMSALTLDEKRFGLVRLHSVDHHAGASLGGPIRRDRTFFFTLFQAMPHREDASVSGTPTIPTPTGYQALTSVPLAPGQSIESRRAVLSALDFLPEIHKQVLRYENVQRVLVNGVPIEFGTTSVPLARPGDGYRSQQRLDHRLSDRNTLSYFGSILPGEAPIARGYIGFSNDQFGEQFASSESFQYQVHALSDTHVFGPSLANEARLGFARRAVSVVPRHDSVVRTNINNPGFALGPHPVSPYIRPSDTFEAQDVLSWNRARHTLKFGADWIQIVDTINTTKRDTWTFNTFQAFLNNQASSVVLQLTKARSSLRYLKQNYFVQDDFKVRPNLTVNLGVRYQISSVPRGYFGAATPQIAAAGVPGPLQQDKNDVAPRLGFAYSPTARSGWAAKLLGSGKTVFRGGFGVAYGIAFEGESVSGLFNNYPYNQTYTLDSAQVLNRYPGPLSNTPATAEFNPQSNFINFPADAKNPTTHFYSFSIQRQIGHNYFVEAGYTGNRSYHLSISVESNPSVLTPEQALTVAASRDFNSIPAKNQRRIHPEWGNRVLRQTSAYSRYDAGYIKFDRRFGRALLAGANYTWSGALSIIDAPGARLQNARNYRQDYARSNMDRPHRLVVYSVWQTPGKRLWGGWRISGVAQWQSGQPFTVITGVDSNGDVTNSDRPDYNPAGLLRLDSTTGNWRSFQSPLVGGRFVTPLNNSGTPLDSSVAYGGNLGRNTFRGPGLALWNLNVEKPFPLTERVQLELRADSTNVFNHRNFGPPVASMNNVNFGTNNSNPPSRVMLLGAKLRF